MHSSTKEIMNSCIFGVPMENALIIIFNSFANDRYLALVMPVIANDLIKLN